MIGLVLVTHGYLANELIRAMEHVVGHQENVEAICIGAEDDMDQRRSDILSAVKNVNTEDGVVVATDMFGGTPCNLAISIMDNAKLEVIAGVATQKISKSALRKSKRQVKNI
jgi:PTS system mannose-specific IIA component